MSNTHHFLQRISNENQHEILLMEGCKFLDENVSDANRKLLAFSASFCMKMIEGFGKDKIAGQFALNDYEDPEFVQQLTLRIEFGVPVFIIQANLYNKIIKTEKLLPVVTAVNFCIAENMATVFNRLGVRSSSNSCVYSNSALLNLVNRTMERLDELDFQALNKFVEVL